LVVYLTTDTVVVSISWVAANSKSAASYFWEYQCNYADGPPWAADRITYVPPALILIVDTACRSDVFNRLHEAV
jgi:hypothetical protein